MEEVSFAVDRQRAEEDPQGIQERGLAGTIPTNQVGQRVKIELRVLDSSVVPEGDGFDDHGPSTTIHRGKGPLGPVPLLTGRPLAWLRSSVTSMNRAQDQWGPVPHLRGRPWYLRTA